jgi:hypothetical protein
MLDALDDDRSAAAKSNDAATEQIATGQPPPDPMALECIADRMLLALRGTGKFAPLAYFDWTDPAVDPADAESDAVLSQRKPAADLLTKARLAAFSDNTRTGLMILNAGRYWSLHGGYLAYLKQDQARPPKASVPKIKEADPIQELNAKYMRWRVTTFWWSFALSTASFIISLTIFMLVLTHRR